MALWRVDRRGSPIGTGFRDLGCFSRPSRSRPYRTLRGTDRFEVDGANAARSFLKDRGIPTQQLQFVWDAIALHTTRSIALHKQPEVAVTHAGIAMDVIGAGLDLIPKDKVRGILAAFPRLSMKAELKASLCSLVRRKPETTYDNVLKDIGTRYVDGYAAPSFADLLENAPFAE